MNTKPNIPTNKVNPTGQGKAHQAASRATTQPSMCNQQSFQTEPTDIDELVEMFEEGSLDKEQSGPALLTYLLCRRDGHTHSRACDSILRKYYPFTPEQRAFVENDRRRNQA